VKPAAAANPARTPKLEPNTPAAALNHLTATPMTVAKEPIQHRNNNTNMINSVARTHPRPTRLFEA
jgi:hypothetical protein